MMYKFFLISFLFVFLGCTESFDEYSEEALRSSPVNEEALAYLLKNGALTDPTELKTHFLNYTHEKEDESIIRIGVLGDSHSAGVESEFGQDWTSLLEAKLLAEGYKVEVLNFATGGYGFQQAYYAYEQFGQFYNLDYILLGPGCFQQSRDLTFSNFYPSVRWRYILKEKNVDLVGVEAKNLQELYQDYHGWFPSWEFFKYDRLGPTKFRGFFTHILNQNPFYYSSKSPKDEVLEINRILLSRLVSRHPSRVLLLHSKKRIIDGFDVLATEIEMHHPERFKEYFPFWQHDHNSVLGHERWVEFFYSALTKTPPTSIPQLVCQESKGVSSGVISNQSVSSGKIKLKIDNEIIGELGANISSSYEREKKRAYRFLGKKLLAVYANAESLQKALIFFAPKALDSEGLSVRVEFDNGDEEKASFTIRGETQYLLEVELNFIEKLEFHEAKSIWGLWHKEVAINNNSEDSTPRALKRIVIQGKSQKSIIEFTKENGRVLTSDKKSYLFHGPKRMPDRSQLNMQRPVELVFSDILGRETLRQSTGMECLWRKEKLPKLSTQIIDPLRRNK